MTLAKHLDATVSRMKEASARIEQARAEPASLESLSYWLSALTDYCLALSDLQSFNNESVHEKLHELAERMRVATVAPQGRAQRSGQ